MSERLPFADSQLCNSSPVARRRELTTGVDTLSPHAFVSKPMRLKARIARDMTGIDTDLYDRCLKIRRDLENKLFSTDAEHVT